MQSRKDKKIVSKPNGNGHKSPGLNGANTAIVFSDNVGSVGSKPQPYRLNPESLEEREKRLAKRKALTLKAFRKAYENRQAEKVS